MVLLSGRAPRLVFAFAVLLVWCAPPPAFSDPNDAADGDADDDDEASVVLDWDKHNVGVGAAWPGAGSVGAAQV